MVIVLILMGAMVTSTGSGMAFSDWPMSDGQLMPERALTEAPAFLEHFHRLVGALCGLLVVTLAIWLQAKRLATPRIRKWAFFGIALISVQGAIGGIGVLKGLPYVTSVLHGTLAQVTIATFAVVAYSLSDRYCATVCEVHPAAGAARKLLTVGLIGLLVQTVLGAIARHAEQPHALWTHVGNAFVLFLLLFIAGGFLIGRLQAIRGILGLVRWLLVLLIVQIALGFVALLVRTGKDPSNIEHLWRSSLISAHVLVGALLTVITSLLAAHVCRCTRVAPTV
ncbi:hypothetical protein LBMAG49_06670 [Planctomycetota bacterium]|nr:hypothetical protein LBMAG49_06670 [Planctomycetota bacterium]